MTSAGGATSNKVIERGEVEEMRQWGGLVASVEFVVAELASRDPELMSR